MTFDANKFRTELQRSIELGASIVPLVGSGLSVASGIPAGQEFTGYLTYALYECFEHKWDLSNEGWPPVPTEAKLHDALAWKENKFKTLSTLASLRPSDMLLLEGLGCLGDWRSTLIFLSRLRPKQTDLSEMVARSPILSIIDAFNVFITRGKHFSMGHKMLAYLSPVMGTRLILTTNFDTLIEQAFAAIRNDLTVFNVSIAGRLPDHRVVRSQSSIIKLHGGMSETRADYSLDEEPTEIDKQQFLNYLIPRQELRGARKVGAPACLLVVGFSGRDRRIIDFIHYALQETRLNKEAPGFKVFWIGYTENDSERARNEFSAYYDAQVGTVHVTQTLRPDLLLLELYHDLTYCLPPGGLPFSICHRLPPFPGITPTTISAGWCDESAFNDNKSTLLRVLTQSEPYNEKNKSNIAYLLEGTFGVSSVASAVYWSLLADHKKCIWLDLEDFHNAAMAETQLFKTICNRRGLLELETITLSSVAKGGSDWEETELDYSRLIDYLKIRPSEWFIFLNGRYELGVSSSIGPHRWNKDEELRLNKIIAKAAKAGFKVIYLPPINHARDFLEHHKIPIYQQFRDNALGLILKETLQWILTAAPSDEECADNVRQKEHFLYAIALCRQSRHLSLLSSEAAFPVPQRFDSPSTKDYDKWRGDKVRRWASELTAIGLLRVKPGGFYTLRTTARQMLVALLSTPHAGDEQYLSELLKREPKFAELRSRIAAAKASEHNSKARPLRHVEARIHHWIAEWYLKAFRVTHDSLAFIECLHHRYMCLLASEFATPPEYLISYCELNENWDKATATDHFRLQMAAVAIGESIKLLRISRPIIKTEVELTVAEKLFATEDTKKRLLALDLKTPNNSQSWKTFIGAWLELWERENKFLLKTMRDEAGIILYRRLGAIDHNVLKSQNNPLGATQLAGNASDTEIVLLEKDFSFIVNLRKKQFAIALKHVKQKLNRCQFDPAIADALCRTGIDIRQLRSYLFCWLAKQSERNRSKLLRILLQSFILLLEIKVQTAKVVQERKELRVEDDADTNAHWKDIAIVAGAFIRLSWHLPPEDVDLQNNFNVTVRSLLGLSFAYLGRFYEAHRRYEEASAFLANTPMSGEIVTWGILDSRRAESLICEAAHTRKQRGDDNSNQSRILACLDDAWEALEKAERTFAGKSRSVWWWGRLSILKLRVFKELSLADKGSNMMPLSDRTLLNRREHIHQILEKGLLLNPRDIVRTSRLAEHYLSAIAGDDISLDYLERLSGCLEKDLGEMTAAERTVDPDRENVVAYASDVLSKVQQRIIHLKRIK